MPAALARPEDIEPLTQPAGEQVEEQGMGSAGLEQIAEGDKVLVSYNPETMEALSIDVLPAEEPIAP